jgi:hypothetical protein
MQANPGKWRELWCFRNNFRNKDTANVPVKARSPSHAFLSCITGIRSPEAMLLARRYFACGLP